MLEETRDVLFPAFVTLAPHFSLRVLYSSLGIRRSFHVFHGYRLCQGLPQSTFVSEREKHVLDVTYRRDSLGSCVSSGATHLGDTFCPSLTASKRTRLLPV